jgi:hypothetical protein
MKNGKYIGFDERYSKSAVAGVTGARPVTGNCSPAISSNVASIGNTGAREVRVIGVLSITADVGYVSLPAKSTLAERVKTVARIVIVDFIVCYF